MDGRGRALTTVERLWRSVKYEDLYLKSYDTVPLLIQGLVDYFLFYNQTDRTRDSTIKYPLNLGKEMPRKQKRNPP